MELCNHRFYLSGRQMNFAVYSDDPCRARYLKSIALPLGPDRVDVYEIAPGSKTQWVVIRQKEGDKTNLKLFIRRGRKFLEKQIDKLPRALREKIIKRFPQLLTPD
ncbi:MAG: hypothetical protein DMG05_12495 [Acidobacteria bacterium]|nr:MAG: hypothetical protein DMG05_12495 [Acidobacteriota bacterium]